MYSHVAYGNVHTRSVVLMKIGLLWRKVTLLRELLSLYKCTYTLQDLRNVSHFKMNK